MSMTQEQREALTKKLAEILAAVPEPNQDEALILLIKHLHDLVAARLLGK